jgi:3-oxoacyl-[acyl-carrier-protein] synthase II
MVKRRIVITGMGLISSLGEDLTTFWQNVQAGKSGVSRIQRFDPEPFDSKIGGECFSFDPTKYIDRKEIKRLDRFAQFALSAAILAGQDAGLPVPVANGDRVGVIIGSGIGGLTELEEQHIRLRDKGPSKVSAFTIPKLMVNAGSGNISLFFGARGINTAVATACASATNAMGDAYRAIQRNEADMLFTGGAEAALTPLGISSFCAMKALSTRNNEPERASRPFDKDRDGFVMGEGSGILVFEELEHAKARNAKIYGEVIGFGASADSHHLTAPEPEGSGAAMAMTRALADAGINPSEVDYINAHGTSTSLGDIGETKAVKRVFGEHAYKLAISSTKSMIGHLLGASGGVELITTLLGMRDSLLPPTINLDHPDSECDLDYVPFKPKTREIRMAMSNSFGFGGHNACIIVKKYE